MAEREPSTYTREDAIRRSRADMEPEGWGGEDLLNAEEVAQEPVPTEEPVTPKTPKEQPAESKRSYTEQDLISALRKAHEAKDVPAAQAIARRIVSMREASTPVDRNAEMAVSHDISPQTVAKNPYLSADAEAGMWEGITSSFSGSAGVTIETMLPAWLTGRLMGENPKTGEIELFQSTPSWLGVSDDKWESMSPEQRRVAIQKRGKEAIDKTYDPDRTSAAYNIAKFAGMLTDPTTAIPLTGGPLSMVAKGSALGGTDAALYSYAEDGKVDPKLVALGAGLGSIPGVGKGAYRGAKKTTKAATAKLNRLVTPKERTEAMERVAAFDKVFNENRKILDNPTTAYYKTLDDLQIKEPAVVHWMEQAKPRTKPAKAGTLSKIFEPISDRVRKISPTLHKALLHVDRQILETSHTVMTMSDEFLDMAKKLSKVDALTHHSLKKAMLNSDGETISRIVSERMGEKGMKAYGTYKTAMDDMWSLVERSRNGKIGPKVEHYTHRAVKDYKKIEEWIRNKSGKVEIDKIQKLIKQQFKGRKPTEEELNAFYSRYLDGVYDAKKVKTAPSATKGRKLRAIPDELVDAFHDPDLATHSYVRSMTEDAYKKSLFGKDIVSKHGDNLTDSIDEFINKEYAAGRLDADDIDEIKNLLELRFVEGLKKPHAAVQQFKDYSYAMLLGNPISAATQVGDIFLAAWKVGFTNTLDGVAKAITRRGLKPKEWGLMDSMLEEMVSTGTSKKWLRRALTHGNIPLLRSVSFQNIDRIGKATLMNGSLRKYQKLAMKNPEKLRKQWGKAFGNDFDTLVNELKASAKGSPPSSNVKTLVFADLADVQPVTLLEMPEVYLRNPNGRIGYMLRTFQLKYINLLRKTMVEGFEKGNRTHAVTSGMALMAMFTAGGVTSDMLKHAMLNRDPNVDEIVVDNILANTGLLSRYDVEKLGTSRTPISHIASTLAPPVGIFDPFAYAFGQVATGSEITREDKARMMAKLPIAGRILENYGFGGRERFADRQFEKSMTIDVDVE